MDDFWFARDKAEHLAACFTITVLVSQLAGLSSRLRQRRLTIGCVAALLAGAAKEAGDQIGLWPSAGASAKDAVADALGVVLAALLLWTLHKLEARRWRQRPAKPVLLQAEDLV